MCLLYVYKYFEMGLKKKIPRREGSKSRTGPKNQLMNLKTIRWEIRIAPPLLRRCNGTAAGLG